MIDKSLKVYEINDTQFDCIGEIDDAQSIIVVNELQKCGSIEVTVPITEKNVELLVKDNVISVNDKQAYFIEYLNYDTTESDGQKKMILKIKGRDLKKILTQRIVWDTFFISASQPKAPHVAGIMYDLVNENFINCTDENRKYPYLRLFEGDMGEKRKFGKVITNYQKTGGEVFEALQTLAQNNELGFDIEFDRKEKEFKFLVTQGKDRTKGNEIICLSTDLSSILGSIYTYDNSSEKGIVLIAGAGEGVDRIKQTIGLDDVNINHGMNRKELYVDARDEQKTVFEDGVSKELTDDEYNALLIQRGHEKLLNCTVVTSFEADIKTYGSQQYLFEKDYNLGDKIKMRDYDIGVEIDAFVTASQESWENDEYKLSLTVGYGVPTIFDKIKKFLK